MTNRDEFTPRTKQKLAERVGYRCSNTECGKNTIGPHSSNDRSVSIGKACHITAASPGGPRYDETMTPEQRKSIDNGIWLCSNCSDWVDKDWNRYLTPILHEWKNKAECKAENEMLNKVEPDDSVTIKIKYKEAKSKFTKQIRNASYVSSTEKSDLSNTKTFEELFTHMNELGNEFLLAHDTLKEIDETSNEAKRFYSLYKSNKEFFSERKIKASAESIKQYEKSIKYLIQKQEMKRFLNFLNLYEEINSFLQFY